MSLRALTFLVVGATFALYIYIAIKARARTTSEFYVAGAGIHPILNGMATGADWMSAASFISMAGLIAFKGYDASVYLMGWTGGYVLLAMLLAPYLRKYGKYTVPEFIGDRYYSKAARMVAIICLVVASLTYVIGQMKGIGVAFSRFMEVHYAVGLVAGMAIVFVYAVLGGMKGITYTQIAQYCVLIFAYTVPAVFISLQITGNPIPQLGLGSTLTDGSGTYLLDKLDLICTDLGFAAYSAQKMSTLDIFLLTMSLMIGTAGLPHVITRFFTVPKVKDARSSAGWALVFIAILYTTAPAVGAMAYFNLMDTVQPRAIGSVDGNLEYAGTPDWFKKWEGTGLLAAAPPYPPKKDGESEDDAKARAKVHGFLAANPQAKAVFVDADKNVVTDRICEECSLVFLDRNGDGRIQYYNEKNTDFAAKAEAEYGWKGNELVKIDNDIMVLANPEIAGLPNWVVALVAAGGIAAALSTAAGLLLAISSAISHDLLKGIFMPNIDEKTELMASRVAMGGAIVVAGYLGLNPPGFAAQVVALAFGLAASSIFPALMMGIFSRRVNSTGAICGMLAGLGTTLVYIFWFKGWLFIPGTNMLPDNAANWLFGISPQSFGAIGAVINFAVALTVSSLTAPVPEHIRAMVEDIRIPAGASKAQNH